MADETVSVQQLFAWMSRFRDLVTEQRAYLTMLDSAIGDADHGSNMARGMAAVMEKLGAGPPPFADELFKTVGMTLVTTVGGASGPLYGTFFLRLGLACGAISDLDGQTLAVALNSGLAGVVARGKADPGDKTMYDAMAPALHSFEESVAKGNNVGTAARDAFSSAEKGREATKSLLARKGRASYLGERSIGHIDPGAASTALLFQALADVFLGD